MPRNLIIGDIHSEYGKLISALERASYDPDLDILYFLGDFCDRGKDALETLRFLMGLSNFHAVIGNHDTWHYSEAGSFNSYYIELVFPFQSSLPNDEF